MPKKPNTTEAMRNLIHEARITLPLDLSPTDACFDECKICAIKLVAYIAMELETWEERLDEGVFRILVNSISSRAPVKKSIGRFRKMDS